MQIVTNKWLTMVQRRQFITLLSTSSLLHNAQCWDELRPSELASLAAPHNRLIKAAIGKRVWMGEEDISCDLLVTYGFSGVVDICREKRLAYLARILLFAPAQRCESP